MQTQVDDTAARDERAAPNELRAVRKLAEYRTGREHIFQSQQSLDWFVRRHRADLVQAGALLLLTGQWHAHAARFDAFVLEAGRAAACKLRAEAA